MIGIGIYLGRAISNGVSRLLAAWFPAIISLAGKKGNQLTIERDSSGTLVDFKGLIKTAKIGEARFEGVRRVENLVDTPEAPVTQNIIVGVGSDYNVRIGAGSVSGATVVFSGAFTGILTSDGVNELSFANGTPKTATTTTLTCTIAGAIADFQVEEVTGQADQNPSEFTLPQWQSKGGLLFDGVDDYIDYGDIEACTFGNGATDISFSVSCIVAMEDIHALQGVFCKATAPNVGEWYILISGGKLYARCVDNSNGNAYIGKSTILSSGLQRVTFTYNGSGLSSGIKIYFEKVAQSGLDSNAGIYVAMENTTVSVTAGSRGGSYLKGYSTDFRVFDEELTQEQINTLVDTKGEVGSEVFWSEIKDREGSKAYNKRGNNNHGKLKNFDHFPKYYDTENGATVDGSGVIIDNIGTVIPESTKKGILIEPQRTNLFLNSKAPATQTITVVNGTEYTVLVIGTGDIVLSNAGTGTVSAGNDITFTAGSTSLVCTVSGSLDYAQVETGKFATSPIKTTGSSATRIADSLKQEYGAENFPQSFAFIATINPVADLSTQDKVIIFGTDDSAGSVDEIYTEGGVAYDYTHATGGGKFIIKSTDFVKNTFYKIGFSLMQESTNIRAIIVVDRIEKLNILVVGTLDHSDTGDLFIGSHDGNIIACNFKYIKVYKEALTSSQLKGVTK